MATQVIPSLLGGVLTDCERIPVYTAMGAQFFKAQHAAHGTVFCKILPEPDHPDEAKRVLHYIRSEIKAGALLKGTHVRKMLFDVRVEAVPQLFMGPAIFMVFEWVNYTLDDVLKEGRPLPVQCLRLLAAIARGLEEAHSLENPIRHRDVKPQNVLVADRRDLMTAKLADFGISKMVGATRVTTYIAGTPLYMAPEQFPPRSTASERSDVYALALLAWYVMTGELPMSEGSAHDIQRRREQPQLPKLQVGGHACPNVRDVMVWALAADPQERLPSPMLLAEAVGNAGVTDGVWSEADVRSALEESGSPPPPVGVTQRQPNLVRPSAALAVIVGPDPITRPQVSERLWSHIFGQGLKVRAQDIIRTDDALRSVCDGRTELRSAELNRIVEQHLTPC